MILNLEARTLMRDPVAGQDFDPALKDRLRQIALIEPFVSDPSGFPPCVWQFYPAFAITMWRSSLEQPADQVTTAGEAALRSAPPD